jgi:putative transposase
MPAHRLLQHRRASDSAHWAAQQVVEAFPHATTPRRLLTDRDSIYGDAFRRRMAGRGIAEVICSPASPWLNPYAERVIGSIRREYLDHVIVLGEAHLRRRLSVYVAYYHRRRTHLGLGKDTRDGRPVQPASRADRRDPRSRWAPSPIRASRGVSVRALL